MNELPAPLTSADCDLRGLPFMPLDVLRVIDSDIYALSTGDEFKAAFALWCKSWNQVPAGSLPNDDRIIAHLSGAKVWKKVKDVAMRGWVLCSDNRWYHPVVAEKAMEALPMRLEFEDKKSAEAARKTKERADRKAMFELLRSHGIVPDWNTTTKQLREMARLYMSQHVTPPVTPNVTDESQQVTARTGTVKGQGHILKTTTSVPDGTGDKSPPGMNANEALFQVAVPWLVANGCKESNIRSLLGGAVKQIGADAAWELASSCMREKPLEPMSWLAGGINDRIKIKSKPADTKFNFEGVDRSGDKAAMNATMAKHGITVPAGEVNFD